MVMQHFPFPMALATAAVVKTTQYAVSSSSRYLRINQGNNGNEINDTLTQQHVPTQPSKMMSSAEDATNLTFRCKCGAIQATLKGAPGQIMNCHCHSCVASARCIESKPNFSGISVLDVGGVAYADFRWPNVNFTTLDTTLVEARDKISFVKVGDKGKFGRAYCTSCGTMLGIFIGWRGAILNRNAIFNRDGSPYESSTSVINIMLWFGFDPSKAPQPAYNFVPLGMAISFIPLLLGLVEKKETKDSALFPIDMSSVEVVPITWE